MVRLFTALISLSALVLGGCANFQDEGWQTRRPLGNEIPTHVPAMEPSSATQPANLVQEPTGPLTLRQALALALLHNPELASVSWKVRMAEARRVQAGLPPNPEIAFDIETFGALSTAERTLQLGQVIFLSGKLERQTKVAALERDLAGWDYEAKRIAVYTATVKAFVALRAAQENVGLTEQIVATSQKMVDTAAERVRSGKASPIEEMKARVELGQVRLDLERARQEVLGSRKRLASLWGSLEPKFAEADAPFELGPAIPPAEQLTALLQQNPDVARWATELHLRQAVTKLEHAKAIPDPTLGGGFKRADGRNGWTAGVAIAIPIFDRNQGGIRESEYGVAQVHDDRRAAEAQAFRDLSEAYQLLATAHAQATILQTQILPEAQKAFDASSEGYAQGKFAYLDVLDAQRTLFDAKSQWVQTVADYFAATANVEGLIGQSLMSVQNEKPQQAGTATTAPTTQKGTQP
jgi:outer membrane protein, heavy metal efflux system